MSISKELEDEINSKVAEGLEKVKKRLPMLFDTDVQIERLEWEIKVLTDKLGNLKRSKLTCVTSTSH